ncbi:MAG TPA: hypothetical protein VF503_29120 [Sphingobium sp.]|uniref:hypothetical protein n=1 Tax=Sphingobium sp. TaxID=1912891 RepID=UPI002ED559F8
MAAGPEIPAGVSERPLVSRKRLGCRNLVLGSAALVALGAGAFWLSGREPVPVALSVTPDGLKPVGTVSDRFLSYNVEMVEVTGGRFWRPYKDGKRKGDDRYEHRGPLDLSDQRLTMLAKALGPAYVRFSGTWANATYFDPDGSTRGKAPKGFDTVLTGKEWLGAIDFARAVDAQIVTSFATSPGVRDSKGVWQSAEADRLIAFTRNQGATIAAAEFANEPETVELTQAPKGYTPADYRRDYGRFYDWIRKASPSTKILAPGAAELGEPTAFLRKWASGYTIFDRRDLIAAGQHKPDGVSFHFYGGGSVRCGEMPLIGYGKKDALSKSWLGLIDKAISTTADLRDKVAPGAPLWLTETGETACGGNPWAATFTDTFRFTDQLARSARQGVDVFIHNTLSASDYGLIDETSYAPRPNYWAAWLWRRFMGTKVLDAGKGTTGLHLYAHCLRDRPGGVAMLAINLDEKAKREMRIPMGAQLYTMQQGRTDAQATLNGRLMQVGPAGDFPALTGVQVEPGRLELQPTSINFIAFPAAGNPACR